METESEMASEEGTTGDDDIFLAMNTGNIEEARSGDDGLAEGNTVDGVQTPSLESVRRR